MLPKMSARLGLPRRGHGGARPVPSSRLRVGHCGAAPAGAGGARAAPPVFFAASAFLRASAMSSLRILSRSPGVSWWAGGAWKGPAADEAAGAGPT